MHMPRHRRPATAAATANSDGGIAADAYPRSLYQWLPKDERLLRDGICDGKNVFEIASQLDREPTSVLQHLSELDALAFESESDEQVELFALALGGVSLAKTILWCIADPDRPTYAEIEAMRSGPDLREILSFVRERHIWGVNAFTLPHLQWLCTQSSAAIAEAADAIAARFDAVTPKTLRDQLCGVKPEAVVDVPSRRYKGAKTATGMTVTKRTRKGGSSYSKRRYSRGKSKRSFVPMPDQRTVAERAWESKTSWD